MDESKIALAIAQLGTIDNPPLDAAIKSKVQDFGKGANMHAEALSYFIEGARYGFNLGNALAVAMAPAEEVKANTEPERITTLIPTESVTQPLPIRGSFDHFINSPVTSTQK